jgi:hypothetical protein
MAIVWFFVRSSPLVLAAESTKAADETKLLADKFTGVPTCIERAEYYYLDFETSIEGQMTEQGLVAGADYRLFVNRPYVAEIGNFFQYNKLGPVRFGESEVDFRLGAKFYVDGKVILSVFVPRSMASMKVNGKYYPLHPNLVSILVEQLPPQAQQSAIRALCARCAR